MKQIKNIAIISFLNKKTELIEWSYFNKNTLMPHQIFSSDFALHILEGTLNKKVNLTDESNLSKHRGLCNLITEGKIDVVIIFGEANEIFNNKDLVSLLETAVKHNVVVAANKTTADFILHSPLLEIEYKIQSEEKKFIDNKNVIDTTVSAKLAKAS